VHAPVFLPVESSFYSYSFCFARAINYLRNARIQDPLLRAAPFARVNSQITGYFQLSADSLLWADSAGREEWFLPFRPIEMVGIVPSFDSSPRAFSSDFKPPISLPSLVEFILLSKRSVFYLPPTPPPNRYILFSFHGEIISRKRTLSSCLPFQ